MRFMSWVLLLIVRQPKTIADLVVLLRQPKPNGTHNTGPIPIPIEPPDSAQRM